MSTKNPLSGQKRSKSNLYRDVVNIKCGKSNIKANLDKIKDVGFDKIVFVATSSTTVTACQKAIDSVERSQSHSVELLNWLDIS